MTPTYHLHQNGQVSGPFALEQIRAMWQAGAITADAQACAAGSETWQPVQHIAQTSASIVQTGNLTALGRVGTALFTALALPCFTLGLLGFGLGLGFLLLAGLSFCRARAILTPAPTWHTWLVSLCIVGAVIMAALAWVEFIGM